MQRGVDVELRLHWATVAWMWTCASTERRRRECGVDTSSSVSDPASTDTGMVLKGASDANPRKRKAVDGGKGKGKDASMSTTSAKDLLNKEDAEEQNSCKGKVAQSISENGGKK